MIVGVGDITGDGKVDLVSRHSAGNVWRNNGDGYDNTSLIEVLAQPRAAFGVGSVVAQRGSHPGTFPVQPVP